MKTDEKQWGNPWKIMKTTEKAIINNEKQWNTQWKIMKTNGKWWNLFKKNKKKKKQTMKKTKTSKKQ